MVLLFEIFFVVEIQSDFGSFKIFVLDRNMIAKMLWCVEPGFSRSEVQDQSIWTGEESCYYWSENIILNREEEKRIKGGMRTESKERWKEGKNQRKKKNENQWKRNEWKKYWNSK